MTQAVFQYWKWIKHSFCDKNEIICLQNFIQDVVIQNQAYVMTRTKRADDYNRKCTAAKKGANSSLSPSRAAKVPVAW